MEHDYTLEVTGLGLITVIAPEGEPGYRVRLESGEVTAFPAHSGNPSPENAAADIAHALANPPPAPVPAEITRAQFIIAARRVLGLTEGAVYATITAAADFTAEQKDDARDWFENALTFRRDHALLNAFAEKAGVTATQLDAVFQLGATLD